MYTIPISEDIYLQQLVLKDFDELRSLMLKIYPPSYQHLWPDNGAWYLDQLYNLENFKNELYEISSDYYFIRKKSDPIGILKINKGLGPNQESHLKYTKIHRIYLHQNTQGKGYGKKLMNWVESFYGQPGSILWLEVMDTQDQALHFYTKLGYKIVSSFQIPYAFMISKYRGMHIMTKVLN